MMTVVRPIVIDNGVLQYNNIVENDYQEWAPATAYLSGTRVIRSSLHKVYEALDNLSISVGAPEADPLSWSLVGPTNAFAMFDSEVSTQTETIGPIEFNILATNVNTLALLNIAGESITVTLTEGPGGPIRYSYTQSLIGLPVSDWYEYFFSEPQQTTEVMLSNIPNVPDGRLNVRLDSVGRSAIGQVIAGTTEEIGQTQLGATAGIIDYSRKDTDELGTTTFVKRRFSKRLSVSLFLDNSRLNFVSNLLTDLRATPTLWIGSDDPVFGPLVVYGFYRDFSINIEYSTVSFCSIEIEGLT